MNRLYIYHVTLEVFLSIGRRIEHHVREISARILSIAVRVLLHFMGKGKVVSYFSFFLFNSKDFRSE